MRPVEHLALVVREWTGAAVDLLFPPLCPACGEPGGDDRRGPLCGRCWRAIVRLRPPWCAICGRPFGSFEPGPSAAGDGVGERCAGCMRRRPPFTYARSATAYDGVVREALHAFKFGGATGLAAPLAELMLEACAEHLPVMPDLVVPVPLHRARRRARGFNQAVLLARRVARGLGVPTAARALARTRATHAQSDLPSVERAANVRGAFAVRERAALDGRHVLLVDDVLTTGATVAECARVALAAGARTAGVLTVARVA